jgi:hypothetical protein
MLVDKGAAEVGRALETLRRVTQMQCSVTGLGVKASSASND